MTKKVFLTTVVLEIHWGYSIRTFPGSAIQQGYVIPPPTTIVGALAYPYNGDNCVEMYFKNGDYYLSPMRFVEDFWPLYITSSFPNLDLVPPRALQRIRYFSAPYRATMDIEDIVKKGTISALWSSIPIGYVVAPCTEMAIHIISAKPMSRRYLWSITRIGSRESLASVKDIVTEEASYRCITRGDTLDINTATPSHIVAGIQGNFYEEVIPFPIVFDEWRWVYSVKGKQMPSILRPVKLPLPKARIAIAVDAIAVSNSKGDVVVMPRELVQNLC